MRAIVSIAAVALMTTTVLADVSTSQRRRIQEAASVLKEIQDVPDKDIPIGAQSIDLVLLVIERARHAERRRAMSCWARAYGPRLQPSRS